MRAACFSSCKTCRFSLVFQLTFACFSTSKVGPSFFVSQERFAFLANHKTCQSSIFSKMRVSCFSSHKTYQFPSSSMPGLPHTQPQDLPISLVFHARFASHPATRLTNFPRLPCQVCLTPSHKPYQLPSSSMPGLPHTRPQDLPIALVFHARFASHPATRLTNFPRLPCQVCLTPSHKTYQFPSSSMPGLPHTQPQDLPISLVFHARFASHPATLSIVFH